MSTTVNESLLTQLLLKHPDGTSEEYHEFYAKIIEHRFASMLHMYDLDKDNSQVDDQITTLPVEREIGCLLNNGQPELFLKNIIYHLRRNKKVLPPVLLPAILSLIKDHPELWLDVYRQHPKLTHALGEDRDQWNYINRAFDPEITLEIGYPGYYDSLGCRMEFMPLRTSAYILKIYPVVSAHQQARLLEILDKDDTPETQQFIVSQVNHSRKPVRLAALRSCLIRKDNSLYETIRNSLFHHLKYPNQEPRMDQATISWKDLGGVCNESSKENILIALTDPDEYLQNQTPDFLKKHRSTLLKAATFHRSQKTIIDLHIDSPTTIKDTNMALAMDSTTATKILFNLLSDQTTALDPSIINLLKKVFPFLNEADSDLLWNKFTKQWDTMPFTLETLPLNILALRIHPNRIKLVWQHPLLQGTNPALCTIRDTLKHRLDFLKKCYKN